MLNKSMMVGCAAVILYLIANSAEAMVNPSSRYCQAMGYDYKTAQTKRGKVGLCILPDGRMVNAWDFFLGKVALDWSYCTRNGYKPKHIENSEICANCLACVKGEGEPVPVAELMKLSFAESKCGDGHCGTAESYENCPDDCLSGGTDEICDQKKDGRCDPDCVEQGGHDPDCTDLSADALPLQLILNADVNSTLITHDGRIHNLTGRASAYLIRQPGKTLEPGFIVNALNIVYFGVPQEIVTGHKSKGKPTGVLGFSLDQGKEQQILNFNAEKNEMYGVLHGQIDLQQIYEIAKVKPDPKADDIPLPTQPAKIVISMKPSQSFKKGIAATANSVANLKASVDLAINAEDIKMLDMPAYEIITKKAFTKLEITWERWWEVAKQLCLQPVGIAREWQITPELGPITVAISGEGLDFGIAGAHREWNKADITFQVRDWMLVHDERYNTLKDNEEGDLLAEVDVDDCIEMFFVSRFEPSDNHGGGVTYYGGSASSKIISSDENAVFGVDLTHLAHELGHVITFKHPGSGYPNAAAPSRVDASGGTLMCASGFRNDNPRRNSQWNADKASNPLFTFTFKVISEGLDCSHSDGTGLYIDNCPDCP